MRISAIDLFCGVGGLSFGLKKAGVPVLAGIDLDATCKYAYESNVKGDFIEEDVSSLKGQTLLKKYWKKKKEIKILVGCAPCQPFSTHANKIKGRETDEKWNLLNDFTRLIKETNPQVVSMENVPNLANQKIFEDFVEALKKSGYQVTYTKVYCPDYGIPQKRRRLVLLASKFGKISLVPKTHTRDKYVSVKAAIGDLPPVEAGEVSKSDPLHRTVKLSDLNLKRILASKPNGTWLDWDEDLRLACHKKETGASYKSVYGRMSWEEPSTTITTQFYNYGTGRFGHPSQNRAITIREAAILQSFPKNYKFYKTKKEISISTLAVHIGNAVPVDLGYIIGLSIKAHLNQHGKKK